MKHYYALEQTNDRPTLHVFYSKKERDEFVREYEPCDLNHSIDVATPNIARKVFNAVTIIHF